MHKYLETFFRHSRPLLGVVLAALTLSVGFAMMQPRTYEASARVWFQNNWFQSASIVSATSQTGGGSSQSGATASPGGTAPADVARGVFRELLRPRSLRV